MLLMIITVIIKFGTPNATGDESVVCSGDGSRAKKAANCLDTAGWGVAEGTSGSQGWQEGKSGNQQLMTVARSQVDGLPLYMIG